MGKLRLREGTSGPSVSLEFKPRPLPDPTASALDYPLPKHTHTNPTRELLFAILFPVDFGGPWLSPGSPFPALRIFTVQ